LREWEKGKKVVYNINNIIIKVMEMNMTVEKAIEMYANGIITDRECCDMIDVITGEYTTIKEKVDYDLNTEEEMEHDYKWDVDNAVEYDYELEASQYDYL
jgi:hypothetical protein